MSYYSSMDLRYLGYESKDFVGVKGDFGPSPQLRSSQLEKYMQDLCEFTQKCAHNAHVLALFEAEADEVDIFIDRKII